MDIRFPFSPAEIAKVRMVQFGILSPDEIVISLSDSLFSCLAAEKIQEKERFEICFCLDLCAEANVSSADRAQRDDGEREAEARRA